MPGRKHPTVPALKASGVLMARAGDASVVPYPSKMRIPKRSFQSFWVDGWSFSAPANTYRSAKKS